MVEPGRPGAANFARDKGSYILRNMMLDNMPSRAPKTRRVSSAKTARSAAPDATDKVAQSTKSSKVAAAVSEKKNSAKDQLLLKRQAAMIKRLQSERLASSTDVPNPAKVAAAKKISPSKKNSVRDLAIRLGIWNASGKLTPSYKK